MTTKTYRRHNCARAHRTTRAFMECAVKRAAWVVGDGPYALIAWCRVPTVSLHQDVDGAEKSKAFIDDLGCGGKCVQQHEIVHVTTKES